MLMPGSKSASSSPLEKLHAVTANSVERLELPHPDLFEDQKVKFGHEHHLMGPDRTTNITMTSWRTASHDSGPRSDLLAQSSSLFAQGNRVSLNGAHYENGLFSSSLSDMLDKKCTSFPPSFKIACTSCCHVRDLCPPELRLPHVLRELYLLDCRINFMVIMLS